MHKSNSLKLSGSVLKIFLKVWEYRIDRCNRKLNETQRNNGRLVLIPIILNDSDSERIAKT